MDPREQAIRTLAATLKSKGLTSDDMRKLACMARRAGRSQSNETKRMHLLRTASDWKQAAQRIERGIL